MFAPRPHSASRPRLGCSCLAFMIYPPCPPRGSPLVTTHRFAILLPMGLHKPVRYSLISQRHNLQAIAQKCKKRCSIRSVPPWLRGVYSVASHLYLGSAPDPHRFRLALYTLVTRAKQGSKKSPVEFGFFSCQTLLISLGLLVTLKLTL